MAANEVVDNRRRQHGGAQRLALPSERSMTCFFTVSPEVTGRKRQGRPLNLTFVTDSIIDQRTLTRVNRHLVGHRAVRALDHDHLRALRELGHADPAVDEGQRRVVRGALDYCDAVSAV